MVKQGDGDKADCVGCIKINAAQMLAPQHPCVPKRWKFTFELCDGPIGLESNHLPTVPAGWCIGPDKELQKRVDLCIMTKWSGCLLDSQEFLVILAHKAMSQNPQLSIRDTSLV